MYSGCFAASSISNLLSSNSDNNSFLSSACTDSNGAISNEIAQSIKSLYLPPNWLGSAGGGEDRSRTNLIINYLPQSYDQNDLQRLFERLGPIKQCKLIRDKTTGASLCYGFVDYVSPQHAAVAINTYHGYETESKRLRVAYASSGGRRYIPGQRNSPLDSNGLPCNSDPVDNIIGWEISVSGLPSEVTESDLMRLFSHFGNILSVRFLPSEHLKPFSNSMSNALSDLNCNTTEANLFGIRNSSKISMTSVIFEDRSSCDTAIVKLNGFQLPDCPTPLCLRLIGPVTRDTYGMFYMNSKQVSECNSISGLHARNMLINQNLISDKNTANMLTSGLLGSVSKQHALKCFENFESNENTMPILNGNASIIPRPIIRNKASIGNNLIDSLDFGDLLDAASISNSLHRSATDRFSTQENQSLFGKQPHPVADLLSKPDLGSQIEWPSSHTLFSLPSINDNMRTSVRPHDAPTLKRLSIVTPLLLSSQMSTAVSQKGGKANVYLKLENLQPTGSVVLRGMEFACRKFAALGGAQHIVCPSMGNAGVAAAFAAQSFGMACTIVTPEGGESLTKKRLAIEAPSTKLVTSGSSLSEAARRAEQLVADANEQLHQINGTTDSAVRYLHPYDNSDVCVGYESLIDELPATQPDVIVTAVGGGGLLAGLIQGLWNRGWSSTHIIAVETEGADCLNKSILAGHPVVTPKCTSIATSLCAPTLSFRAWNMVQCHPITPVTCTDLEAVTATRRFLDEHGILVEPACGAALSVVYSGTIAKLQLENVIPRPAYVCLVVCGGRNMNLQMLADLEKKLIANNAVQMRPPSASKEFGLRQINHLCGIMDLSDAQPCRNRDENGDQFSDMAASSSFTSNSSDANISNKAMLQTQNENDD